MAIKPILQLGDGRLRDVSVAAQDPAAKEIAELIADLQYMLAHSRQTTGYGRGIAAPQLGVALRVAFFSCRAANRGR